MDRRAAKELLHIQGWLERVDEILAKGTDALLQEAGDSLMMKSPEGTREKRSRITSGVTLRS